MGLSLDGNIKTSKIYSNLLHFGIDTKKDNYKIKYTFDYTRDKSKFVENDSGILFFNTTTFEPIYSVYITDYAYINSLKILFKHNNEKNKWVLGAGYRNKIMEFDKIVINKIKRNYQGDKREDIVNLFAENNYQYERNAIFSIGSSISKYFAQNNTHFLKQFKTGHTYLFNKKNILKIFYQHIEFLTGTYLNSTLFKEKKQKPQKTDVLIGKYKKYINNSDCIEFIGMLSRTKNILRATQKGFKYSDKYAPIKIINIRYHKNYQYINDFIFEFSHMYFKKLGIKNYDRLIVLNTHRYKKFEFFENIIYRKSKFSGYYKEGTDLSLGIKYNINDNLNIGFKANNLLNERYEAGYPLVNFFTKGYKLLTTPLIERSVLFTVEYMF